jgi:hypothetical protein
MRRSENSAARSPIPAATVRHPPRDHDRRV